MPLPSLIYGSAEDLFVPKRDEDQGRIQEKPDIHAVPLEERTKSEPPIQRKKPKRFKPLFLGLSLFIGIGIIPLAKIIANSTDKPVAQELQVSAESLVNQIEKLANMRVSYKLESLNLENVRNSYHNQVGKLPKNTETSNELKSLLAQTDAKLTKRENDLKLLRQKAREQLSVLASSVTEEIVDDVFAEIDQLIEASTSRADLDTATFYGHLKTFFQQANQMEPGLVIEAFLDEHFQSL